MAGPTGVPGLSLNLATLAPTSTLRAGQSFQAKVQQGPQGLFASVGGTRVPLDGAADLMPGQSITVRVETGQAGLRLLIQPGDVPPATPGSVPTSATSLPDLPALIGQTLMAFGAADPSGDAPSLLPPGLPPKGEALRALFSLFAGSGGAGKDLETLVAQVAKAVQAGALPQSAASDFLVLAGTWLLRDTDDLTKVLRRLEPMARKGMEARLAAALRGGDVDELAEAVKQDLRCQVSRLLEHDGLRGFLESGGELEGFESAAQGVVDRLVGRDIQNLNGSGHPYLFLELPFTPESGIRQAHLHFWGPQPDRRGTRAGQDAEVALDLSLTRLGDLWIGLSLGAGGRCLCTLRAAAPEAAEALTASAPELAEALKGAGYPHASVHVHPWDGNRLRETAELVRRMAGMDLKV